MARSVIHRIPALLPVLLLAGCTLFGGQRLPDPTSLPPASVTATPSPPAAATEVMVWTQLAPGVEMLVEHIPLASDNSAEVTLLRLDPATIQVRVQYDANTPRSVVYWQKYLQAPIVINGGLYEPNNQPRGILISEGQRYGITYDRHGGMLTVKDGEINVRSLAQFPYDKNEVMQYGLQGIPMLLYPGGFPVPYDEYLKEEAGRRTAIGQDRQGRLILITAYLKPVTLYRLRDWLAERADLGGSVAMNLDGGYSTGLAVSLNGTEIAQDSVARVPGVVAIYLK
jgi:uncharacterized protein YigE (DUF2233 family)